MSFFQEAAEAEGSGTSICLPSYSRPFRSFAKNGLLCFIAVCQAEEEVNPIAEELDRFGPYNNAEFFPAAAIERLESLH